MLVGVPLGAKEGTVDQGLCALDSCFLSFLVSVVPARNEGSCQEVPVINSPGRQTSPDFGTRANNLYPVKKASCNDAVMQISKAVLLRF